jgi:hypothetical protein
MWYWAAHGPAIHRMARGEWLAFAENRALNLRMNRGEKPSIR